MKLIHYLLAFSTIAFTACNNCGGVNETIHTYAMTIENSRDTIQSLYGQYRDELVLNPLSWSEAGDRKCRYKTYVFNFGETIDSNTLRVYCSNDLKMNNTTVPAGENFLERKELFDYISQRFRIVLDTADAARQTFTYYVKGSTSKGNNFIDSVSVYYQ